MFTDKILLAKAIAHKEWHTVSHLMVGLAAQFLEGEMDSSAKLFNDTIKLLPVECLMILKEDATFSCVQRAANNCIEWKLTPETVN